MNELNLDYKFSVAPMMGVTTSSARYMYRLISMEAVLFTEMIASQALHRGDFKKMLRKETIESPVVLQVGGSDINLLKYSTELANKHNYQGINLNVGCPSKKVSQGKMGACLMKEANLVKQCLEGMKAETAIDVSLKCRIGVDVFEGEKYLENFLSTISDYGITTFIIHARKAISGLDTKRNRSIPPLNYGLVYKMKERFPEFKIIINGGIEEISDVKKQLGFVDGVMLGRKIYSDPAFLLQIDKEIYGNETSLEFSKGLQNYMTYILNLDNKKDVNRAITHLIQIIRKISNTKEIRRELLSNVKDNTINLEHIFDGFKEDLNQKVHLQTR